MSRAGATKGGRDKTRAPPPQTPVAATEIVPGKFNESDWNAMLERDSAEDFIHDIVDEILSQTMDNIYKSYLESQLLPFTVMMAKNAILQIIEWQFLARDEGEEEFLDFGWLEDKEPDASVTDCWAQGSVPRAEIPLPQLSLEEEEDVPTMIKTEEIEEEEEEELTMLEPELELEDKVSEGEAPEIAELKAAKEAAAAEANRKLQERVKTKRKFKPYRGKLKPAALTQITESIYEAEKNLSQKALEASRPAQGVFSSTLIMPASCQSILKVQNGRPPGSRDVEYDELGNVISVMRLDADKLPNHRIKVKCQVVDPETEAVHRRSDTGRRRHTVFGLRHLGKEIKNKNILQDTGKTIETGRKPTFAPHPPCLLDIIDVAPGVVITEAGRTKKGPGRQQIKKVDLLEQHQKELKPVTIRFNTKTISVSDLLDRDMPIIRPIDETRPLPPIVAALPSSAHITS